MPSAFRIALSFLMSIAVSTAIGEDQRSDEDTDAIKASFQEMSQRASGGSWQQAAELMTSDAAAEVSAQMLILCIGLRDTEFPMQIPKLDEARDVITSILRDYKLDQLDLPVTMFRFAGQGDKENEKDLQKQAETNLATAKQAIANVEDRWKLVAELQAAIRDLPFGHSASMSGTISQIEVANGTAEVTIEQKPPDTSRSGVQVQIVGPPRIVNFQKVGNQWLFAGINREKTDAAMREFQKSMQSRSGGSDF